MTNTRLTDAPAAARLTGRSRAPMRLLLAAALGLALVAAVVVSACSGQLAIAPADVLGALLRAVGAAPADPSAAASDAALWTIRFPRIVLAVLIGAALAAAGTLMQAVFGNPLAEPSVVGVSSGAALGASASIVLGWTFWGEWTIAAAAFGAAWPPPW